MNRDEITAVHRSRLACVYIRQSSREQVLHHQESQRRQRNLVERAIELGWPRERVVQIDEDLGRSASRSSPQRQGFQHLVADAAMGRYGLIIALEVARLCRANRDWYHLLDICAVMHVLIADGDGLYDPRAYNDRLILGLKGTLSEAELHVIKQRLVEAMRAKAKRGELCFRLPPGFIWDDAGQLQRSPDEQVLTVFRLILERFDQLGTIHQTQCSLAEDGVVVPVLCGRGRNVAWKRPSYRYIHRVLTNPMYAGAYAYGQTQTVEILDEAQRPVKRRKRMAPGDWHVLPPGHHEGYISWEKFDQNQRRVAANRRCEGTPGPPRAGDSLLQGLVLCGRCGRTMKVAYGKSRTVRYTCSQPRQQSGASLCQAFGALRLERVFEETVLECLRPAGVDAMLQAAAAYEEASRSEQAHWQQRVERAHYEAALARRRYEEVDPASRLVARALERRYETALQALDATQAEADPRAPP